MDFGFSYIEAYRHHLVKSGFLRSDRSWCFWVCEAGVVKNDLRFAQENLVTDTLSQEQFRIHQRNLHAVLNRGTGSYVKVSCEYSDNEATFEIACGVEAVAAVYYAIHEQTIRISWDFFDLIKFSPFVINQSFVASHLSRNLVYSEQTLLESVKQLTERSRVVIDRTQAYVHLPETYPNPPPKHLRCGVDALDIFSELIERRLSSYSLSADDMIIELSGGLDSCTVAVALAGLGHRVDGMGIVFPSLMGKAQQGRREAIVQAVLRHDHPVMAEEFETLIFSPPKQNYDVDCLGEIYAAPFAALWDKAASLGKMAVVGGYGGDELFLAYGPELIGGRAMDRPVVPDYLCSNYVEELTAQFVAKPLPNPVLPISTLLALGNHSQSLLRRGLWPVHPLTDPDLNRFCAQLAKRFIRSRSLQRRFIAQVPELAFFRKRYSKESFRPLAWRSFNRSIDSILDVLSNSRLAQFGMVDKERAMNAVTRVAEPDGWKCFEDLVFLVRTEYLILNVCNARKI